MKECSNCGQEKDLKEFGINRAKEDGLQSYCIVCMRESARLRRKKVSKDWKRKTANLKEYQKKYREENKKTLRVKRIAWEKSNPEKVKGYEKKKYEKRMKAIHGKDWVLGNRAKLSKEEVAIRRKARETLRLAIRRGKMLRGVCEVCGEIDAHGHHRDYGKPLEVVWLCKVHHVEEHTALRTGD